MAARLSLDRLLGSLADLGARRLAALAIVGITVFALVGLGGFYLSRPELDVLYSGLGREDVTRIGAALTEAGIPFDVNAEGDTMMVRFSQTAEARMLLAGKGLPQSANAGYELFDQLGSLGLTSFMQQVTRVRAMEGELARTIQSMKGIKAARVHIVLPDEGSFRRERRRPSASVVMRSDGGDDFSAAQAIRHLVAASVPGMTADEVTVLNTDGELLAAGDDTASAAPGRMATLEGAVSGEIQENVRKTLAPYLGVDNFQVSVAARLNTDKRETTETIFDPESRVERSTRVIKEEEESQNSVSLAQASVDQSLPEEEGASADSGEQSSAQNDRREEITNYELSSKTITTSSDGYAIDHLSIAVLVDRGRLAETLGEGATDEAIDAQLADIQALVASAAGLEEARGDRITVSAVDFLDEADALAPVPPVGMGEILLRQTGTMVHAATILIVALLVIWFGLRPATRAILAHPKPSAPANPSLAAGPSAPPLDVGAPPERRLAAPEANLIEDLTSKLSRSPQRRLEQIVQFDEEQAASVLKQWIHQSTAA